MKIGTPVLLGLAILLLQSDLFVLKNDRDVLRSYDENWYGIVLKQMHTMSCRTGIPVTFLYPDRMNFHSCHFFKVMNFLTPHFKNPYYQVAFQKVIAKSMTLVLLCGISILILGVAWPGILLGTWYFLDPGFSSFRPILETILHLKSGNIIRYTQSQRFVSPLHYTVPGMFCVWLSISWVRLSSPKMHHGLVKHIAVAIGLLLGLIVLSLTPVYTLFPYYSLFLAFGVYAYLFCSRATFLFYCGIIIMGATFTLMRIKGMGPIPFEDEVLPRSGFYKKYFDPIFFTNKWVLVTTVAMGFCLYHVFKKRLFVAIFLSLLLPVTLNVNMLTGLEFQNFHFKDYLGLFCFGFLFFYIFSRGKIARRGAVCASIVGIGLGFPYFLISHTKVQSELSEIELNRRNEKEIIAYAKGNFSGAKIYCNFMYPILPLESEVKCSFHHLLYTYPISNIEMMTERFVDFRLQNKSIEEIRELFSRSIKEQNIAVWEHGLDPRWNHAIPEARRYIFSSLIELVDPWLNEYQKFTDSQVLEKIQNYDYFLLKRAHPWVGKQFIAVVEFSEFGFYKLIR